jgi:hypothetical protein
LLQNKLSLAQSKREEAAAALKERTNQALREVALAYDQVDTGLQQYDAAIALQTASDTAFHSASDSYAHGVGTLTDATSAQTGLATARAAVARAHAQSLINAAALDNAAARNELVPRLSLPTVSQSCRLWLQFHGVFYPQPYLGQLVCKIPIAVVDDDRMVLNRRLIQALDADEATSVAVRATGFRYPRDPARHRARSLERQ